jgi:hypothetical protein
VAYFKRTRKHHHPRLIYLGKASPSVEFVEWLAGQPEERVLELARLAVRHLRAALERLAREASRIENTRRFVARVLALAFDLPPAGSTKLRGLLKRASRFVRIVLGSWEAWFAENVLRRPDVRLELERWKLRHRE